MTWIPVKWGSLGCFNGKWEGIHGSYQDAQLDLSAKWEEHAAFVEPEYVGRPKPRWFLNGKDRPWKAIGDKLHPKNFVGTKWLWLRQQAQTCLKCVQTRQDLATAPCSLMILFLGKFLWCPTQNDWDILNHFCWMIAPTNIHEHPCMSTWSAKKTIPRTIALQKFHFFSTNCP